MEEQENRVGRPCQVCRSFKRREIEDDIFSNRPISQISQSNAISSHSIYRHIRNHAAPDLREAFRASVEMNTASLMSRIMEVADSARAIRLSATTELVALRAGAAELQSLNTLVERLGVGNTATTNLAREAMVLAEATAALSKADSRIGDSLVQHLSERGADELAAALSSSLMVEEAESGNEDLGS